jgi:hypothetical protein
MSDQQIGKREIKREYLDLFLEAYERATGETFLELIDSETPDFIARDKNNLLAGIEITSLRFSPEVRQMRSISPARPGDFDAWYQLHALIVNKERSLLQGRWPECARKILVIVMLDASIADTAEQSETDALDLGGFDEVWLADYTQVEPFGAVDLFAIVHPTHKGRFPTGDHGQKPYG